jgi:hypothetical protein
LQSIPAEIRNPGKKLISNFHSSCDHIMTAPPLLETIEIATTDNPTATVIWMHGLGADGADFVPIVRELDQAYENHKSRSNN